MCERVDAPPAIRAYPPPPNMTVQLTPSITFTTSTTTSNRSSSSTIITRGSISAGSATASTASGGLTNSILRDVLAPERNRALRPVLEHQLLHEVVPPLRRAPAGGERLRQRQRRRGHKRVCHTQTPPLPRALALVVAARDAARFDRAQAAVQAVATRAGASRSAHVWDGACEALGGAGCSALARGAGWVARGGRGHGGHWCVCG